jgi:RHS repeat-associated protein
MQPEANYDSGQRFVHSCALRASHYTGKERDAESGLDYFGARYYASTMGRFMSPDWSAKADPVPYAKLEDPQSLNLYVYGGNNPLRYIDTDGHQHQECAPDTGSTDKNGTYTVTAGACRTVSDWYDFQWFRNWIHQANVNTAAIFSGLGSSGGPRANKAFLRSQKRAYLKKYAEEHGGKTPPCTYCEKDTVPGEKGGSNPKQHEFDHIHPQSEGGDGDIGTNGASACKACNGPGGKGASLPDAAPEAAAADAEAEQGAEGVVTVIEILNDIPD